MRHVDRPTLPTQCGGQARRWPWEERQGREFETQKEKSRKDDPSEKSSAVLVQPAIVASTAASNSFSHLSSRAPSPASLRCARLVNAPSISSGLVAVELTRFNRSARHHDSSWFLLKRLRSMLTFDAWSGIEIKENACCVMSCATPVNNSGKWRAAAFNPAASRCDSLRAEPPDYCLVSVDMR